MYAYRRTKWQFYSIRNAILLGCLRKKERGRRSTTVYSMRNSFELPGTCETFLSFSLTVSYESSVVPTTARSGFARYNVSSEKKKTVDLHIYDKHHTIFTAQYTNSLAFLEYLCHDSERETQKLTAIQGAIRWYERSIEICRDKIYRVYIWGEK